VKRYRRMRARCGLGLWTVIRLWRQPRHVPATVRAFGSKIRIVDACTFLSGLAEIFGGDKYQFQASTNVPLILDCGANIGLSVMYFKTLYPNCRIIAFEPDPAIFAALRHNVAQCGFRDVELRNEAVWCRAANATFMTEGGFSGRIAKPGDTASLITVPAVRLRDFLSEPVDFLKLDIEGAEAAVIRDCAGCLRNADRIFVEYHSHVEEPQLLHELLETLNAEGFRYHVKEAYVSAQPFVETPPLVGMDLQLDIFAYRDGKRRPQQELRLGNRQARADRV
jgi:FkbM family methyltransferase